MIKIKFLRLLDGQDNQGFTVRSINAAIRDSYKTVYLYKQADLASGYSAVSLVNAAETRGGQMFVRLSDTGKWHAVAVGDRARMSQ